jgi:hypothetical protein
MGVALHANPYRHVVHFITNEGTQPPPQHSCCWRRTRIRRRQPALHQERHRRLARRHVVRRALKEAGLASGAVETIQATAHLDATYQCINGRGNNPNDPKKTTISSDVSQSGVFTAGQNGIITGSLTLSAPAAATVLDCPSGQTATLTTVKGSSVHVEDVTSGASLAVNGTFSG